jgi:CBS domain-containing protein
MASSDTVSAVAKAMRERGVGTALVLADGIPVGVVSTGDLDPFTPSAPGS